MLLVGQNRSDQECTQRTPGLGASAVYSVVQFPEKSLSWFWLFASSTNKDIDFRAYLCNTIAQARVKAATSCRMDAPHCWASSPKTRPAAKQRLGSLKGVWSCRFRRLCVQPTNNFSLTLFDGFWL